jgi:hypothetical protein
MDITQLILDDHYEQRRLFAIVEQVGSSDGVTLGMVWTRLSAVLEIHAATEEAVLLSRAASGRPPQRPRERCRGGDPRRDQGPQRDPRHHRGGRATRGGYAWVAQGGRRRQRCQR